MIRFALACFLLALPATAADEPLKPVATLGFAKVSGGGTLMISPDGKTVVISNTWYDWATGEKTDPPFPLPEGARWEALLTDGNVVTCKDHVYAIHDGKTGEVERILERPKDTETRPIVFSANGRTAVTRPNTGGKWCLWVAAAPAWQWTPLGTDADWPFAVSDDGSRVCWTTEGETKKAFAHSVPTGKTLALDAEGIEPGIVVSPDGAQACVETKTGYRWFDADGGRTVRDVILKETDRRFDPMFTADGKRLVLFDDVGRWELYPPKPDGPPVAVSPPPHDLHWHAAYRAVRPGNRLFVRGTGHVVREYDLLTGKRRDKHSSQLPKYDHVAAIDDRRAIVWTEAGRYAVWDFRAGKVLHDGALPTEVPDTERKDRAVTYKRARASGDGKTVLVFGEYSFSPVAHIRIDDGRPADPEATTAWVTNPPVFLRDGRTLAVRDEATDDPTRARLTDPKTGKAIGTLPLPEWNCHEPTFDLHPDGRTAIRADAALGVYELATGKLRWSGAVGKPSLAARFADGGRKIVVVGGDVTVFDTRTRRREVIDWTHNDGTGWALSADARWLTDTVARDGLWLDLLDIATADNEGRHVRLPLGTDDDEPASGVAFTPDGKRVLTVSANGVGRAWDVSAITGRPPVPPAEAVLAKADLWELLASDDAKTAGEVMQVLTAAPAMARKLFAEHLTPVPVADPTAVARHIADLGSKDFRTRDAATKALTAVADQAEPLLRIALKATDSAEARERLNGLLAQLEARAVHPDTIRMIRAMEVLEAVGDADAKRLVEKLAKGAANARLTAFAADARTRMK